MLLCIGDNESHNAVCCVQVVESLKRKAQARQGGAENVISAQDIREAVDSFKQTKSLR